MGAGGHLGMRQHIDAAGRAQRHDSAGVYSRAKNPLLFWFFYSCLAPHPVLRTTLSPEGRGNDVRVHKLVKNGLFLRLQKPQSQAHDFGEIALKLTRVYQALHVCGGAGHHLDLLKLVAFQRRSK